MKKMKVKVQIEVEVEESFCFCEEKTEADIEIAAERRIEMQAAHLASKTSKGGRRW
ncbi:hypothetical protein [Desulfurobacterium sp.]